MKKTLSFMLAFCLLCSVFTTGFAATITESGESAEMAVTYGVDMSYIVTIPETVQLTDEGEVEMTVEAYDVLLPSGTILELTVDGTVNAENQWCVTDAADANNSLSYQITDDAGDPVTPGDMVLCVYAGESGIDARLYFTLLDDVVKAGTYTGTLTFNVSLRGGGVYAIGTKTVKWDDMLHTGITITEENAEAAMWQLINDYGVDVHLARGLEEYGIDIVRVTPWVTVTHQFDGTTEEYAYMLCVVEEDGEQYPMTLGYVPGHNDFEETLKVAELYLVVENESLVDTQLMQIFKQHHEQVSTNTQQTFVIGQVSCEATVLNGSISASWTNSVIALNGMTWEALYNSDMFDEHMFEYDGYTYIEDGCVYLQRTYATHILTYASTGEPVHATDVIASENVDHYIFVQQ